MLVTVFLSGHRAVCSKMMIMDLDYFIDICLAGDCHSDLLPVHAKLSANSLKKKTIVLAGVGSIFPFFNLEDSTDERTF